jgi:hypothetical protein
LDRDDEEEMQLGSVSLRLFVLILVDLSTTKERFSMPWMFILLDRNGH